MTADLEIDVTVGRIRGVPVPVTAVDTIVINGPCDLCGWSLRDASGDIAGTGEGTQTSPGALTTIASTATLPAGTYTVNWTVEVGGTLAAADANNMILHDSAGIVAQAIFPAVAGSYPQAPVQITLLANSPIQVQSLNAATAGAVYTADLTAQLTLGVNAVVELQDGNQPLGESSMFANGSDTEDLPGAGVQVTGMIKVHVVQGAVTGVIYVRFDKNSY